MAALPRLSAYGPPSANYSLSTETGLIRTAWMAGTFRQRRLFFHNPGRAKVSWQLPINEVKPFAAWIAAHGFDWFELQLESPFYRPLLGGPRLAWHKVRLVTTLAVTNSAPHVWEVSADVELAPGVPPVP